LLECQVNCNSKWEADWTLFCITHTRTVIHLVLNPTAFTMSTTPVVLVTAGSAGVGAATAKVFATAGYRVVINYSSNEQRASDLLTELEKLSSLGPSKIVEKNFLSIKADLTQKSDIARLVDEVISGMGRLDVVFSNGGWTVVTDFNDLEDNLDEDIWDRCWNMNVKSHLWLFHAAKKHLGAAEGCFITTASLAGVKPSGSSIVSCFLTYSSVLFRRDDHASSSWSARYENFANRHAGILRNQSCTTSPSQNSGHNFRTTYQSQFCLSGTLAHGKSAENLFLTGANRHRNGG